MPWGFDMSEDDESAALAHQQELDQQEQETMTAKVSAAFVKAQAEIEKASKDKTNPHFRNKYADTISKYRMCDIPYVKHGDINGCL